MAGFAGSPPDPGGGAPWSTNEGGDLAAAALAHLDSLYVFATRLAGSRRAADDLVQEAFARALAGRAGFAPGTNLRAWLFRIVRNVYLDERRRARRSPIEPGDDEAATTPNEPLRGDDELSTLRSLVADDIAAALDELPEEARTAILLDAEGLTETELAQVLGCAIGTVKSKLYRARCALRVRLRDYAR